MTTEKAPKCITETRARVVAQAVFFATILYEKCQVHWCRDGMWRGRPCPTAFCDGKNLVFNLDFFEKLTPDGRFFVMIHEIYHAMAMHPRRMKHYTATGLCGYKFSSVLYNIAADAVINKCLVDCSYGKAPEGCVMLPAPGLSLGDYVVTGLELPELVYEKLIENNPQIKQAMEQASKGQGGEGESGGSGSGGVLEDMQGSMGGDVVQPDSQTDSEINEGEMKAAVASAAAAAKAVGQLPGGLKRFIDEFLEPKVSWEEKLRQCIIARAGNDRYNWSRPNRRKLVSPGVYMPRRTGMRCGDIVAAIDTSGSVSDHELRMFLSELASILGDVRPESLTIIWCDAKVDQVDVFDTPEDLIHATRAGRTGGGGTSFIPPFEYVRDNNLEPQTFIYLTDGYAPFPREDMAPFPTLWVMSTDVVAPWGETIPIG
jgi:predicted metal-dependent peptidase